MSFANAIGSALGSAIGSFSFGGGTDINDSAKLMALQNWYWKNNTEWINKEGYKFLREGLVNADYNPILAINKDPMQGAMPNATANAPTMSADMASGIQANVAKEMSQSQILSNKATAFKTEQEGITQKNVRDNLDSDTRYKNAMAIATNDKLPYEIRKLGMEILEAQSRIDLNEQNVAESKERTNYYGKDSESRRIQANAARDNVGINDYNARTNRYRQRADAARRTHSVSFFGNSISGSGVYGKY